MKIMTMKIMTMKIMNMKIMNMKDESDDSPIINESTPGGQLHVPGTSESGTSGNICAVEITQVMGKGQSIDNGGLYICIFCCREKYCHIS